MHFNFVFLTEFGQKNKTKTLEIYIYIHVSLVFNSSLLAFIFFESGYVIYDDLENNTKVFTS